MSCSCDCNGPCQKNRRRGATGATGATGTTGPSSSQPENDLLAGGLLSTSDGKLTLLGAFGVVALEESNVAGEPAWRVTLDPSIEPVPHYVAFGEVANSPKVPVFFTRLSTVGVSSKGLEVDFYLTDGNGVVLNPKKILGEGDGGVAIFHVHRGGTQNFVAK